ncbi:127314ca-dd94-4fbc-9c12-f5e5b2e313b3 [Sclerotinia trifoliorum]|uniref:127314ca-dd94-4fbc-9c12-f5e5b2e313b3 n=1 Tax=Sclerotinia trifoliorum TaxID=28548 RepID=A0A8H2W6X9_9HELO|nr:127314ca-dd94-4fbc-9c12-f5e5b2e313b3 [Sclerotinia trifoliorum]
MYQHYLTRSFEYRLHSSAINDKRVSTEFTFFRDTLLYDDDILGIKFHMRCSGKCWHSGLRSSCFYGKCYSFRLYAVSPKFLATTEYSFRPPIFEEQRRRDRMLHILAKRLMASWTKRLSDELCWMIAGHLIRECAIIIVQELANEDSANDSIIDLSRNVYVRYIMIEGTRYIRSLRNSTQSMSKPGETLLLESQNSSDVRNVYIGEDHLGIRQIQLSSSSKSIPGLWWRQFSKSYCICKIRTRTDGLKLRDLVESEQQIFTAPARINWPVRAPNVSIVDLSSLQAPLEEPKGLRMSFFECNSAFTTGYSLATNGVSIATVHTHNEELDLTFHEEVDSFFGRSMVWIYMPVDDGEYVTEICRRFGFRHIRPNSLGLMFTTNRQRTTLFGCYKPPPSSNADYQFDRIYTPPQTPSRIYFNEWDSISAEYEIKFLGFEHTETPISRPSQNR